MIRVRYQGTSGAGKTYRTWRDGVSELCLCNGDSGERDSDSEREKVHVGRLDEAINAVVMMIMRVSEQQAKGWERPDVRIRERERSLLTR